MSGAWGDDGAWGGPPAGAAASILPPSGGDDSARIAAALAVGDVQLLADEYVLDEQLDLSAFSGRTLRGAGRTLTRITCAVPVGVDPHDPSFAAIYAAPTYGAELTLAANPTRGARTFTTTTSPTLAGVVALGRVALIDSANFVQSFEVVSVAGSSNPWTVTVDSEIEYAFTTGTSVAKSAVCPTAITLAGFTLAAAVTNVRGIQFSAALKCKLVDIGVEGDFEWGASFDTGGKGNEMVAPYVRGSSVMGVGLALESNQDSRIISPDVQGVQANLGLAAGIGIHGARRGGVEGFGGRVDGCTHVGILVDYAASAAASDGLTIADCAITANAGGNVIVGDGTQRIAFRKCRIARSPAGIGLLMTGTAASGLVVRDCAIENNGADNVLLATGDTALFSGCKIAGAGAGAYGVEVQTFTGARLETCDFSTNPKAITTASNIVVERCTFADGTDEITVTGAAKVDAIGCTFVATSSTGTWRALVSTSSARSLAERCAIDGTNGGGHTSVGCTTSTAAGGWDLRRCVVNNNTAGAILINGGSSTVTRDDECTFSGNGGNTGTDAGAANRTRITTS